jgi:hypothetical protein
LTQCLLQGDSYAGFERGIKVGLLSGVIRQ